MRHKEAIIFSIVNLAGCLLPSIITAIYYLAIDKWNNFSLIQQGQLFIYSASILTASAYVLFTWKKKNTDLLSCIFWVSAFMLFISSLLYSFHTAGLFVNDKLLKNGSIFIFLLTLAIYYYANYQNTKKSDIVEMDHNAINNLMQSL